MHIEIPASATDAAAFDPRVDVRDECAGLEYLIPDDEWREHVGRYIDLERLVMGTSGTSCSHTPIHCDDNYQASLTAQDKLEDMDRQVKVFPGCRAGRTKIAGELSDP